VRKLVSRLFILLCAFAMLNGVGVCPQIADATVIFSDNFDDGNDDGWNQFLSTWSAATGEYVTNVAPSDFYTFIGNATWSDYIFEADVKMDMWENDVGLVFYSQPGYTEIIRFTISRTTLNSVWPRITWMQFLDDEGEYDPVSDLATFTNTALTLVDDRWYHFKVEILGNTVSAYIDDVLFALADGPALPFSSGGIGLVSDQETRITSFDNVLVTTNAVPEPCTCDVSGDEEITPQDALCAFQKYLMVCPTSCGIACEEVCCDVTDEGECTPADALEIFKEYLGQPSVCSS